MWYRRRVCKCPYVQRTHGRASLAGEDARTIEEACRYIRQPLWECGADTVHRNNSSRPYPQAGNETSRHGHQYSATPLQYSAVQHTGTPQSATPAIYRRQYSIPTHVAEVVPGVFPLAELAVQPVQVGAEQLELLAAVETELVRRRGDVVAASAIDNTSLGEAGQFLSFGRAVGESERFGRKRRWGVDASEKRGV